MTEEAIMEAHGFTKTQTVRAIAKPLRKRTEAEQA